MCSIMGYCDPNASEKAFAEGFEKSVERGPDKSAVVRTGGGLLGFHRLAIMGLHPEGMQPFERDGSYVVCNGEIYGFAALKRELEDKGCTFVSESDCELLLPLWFEHGVDLFPRLDAEFAMVLYDARTREFVAARDPIGIRPLFYGFDENGAILFASEARNLIGLCEKVTPFPPGHYWKGGKFVCYNDIARVDEVCRDDLETVCRNIHDKLIEGVRKRLVSDAKVGFLLSGGLDSSLVCAIAARESAEPVKTFAIGMDVDAIDLKYAREVAEFIGSDHTEVIISRQDVLDALEPVVSILGAYDITTIRASVGMYLVCKAIHEQTDLRVLLTGEISDELFGYKYTDFAPSAAEFQKEAEKRLPESILWREKAAFSDAVGHSMVDDLKEYAERYYTESDYREKRLRYDHARPFTKESLLYRELFEKYYPGQSEMVADFWMPNKNWEGCDVDDPSARVLSNYGASGL